MNPPKFIEGPNTVQTSLYGYDRSKKVQFQLNNLRGKPIVVLRSDTVNNRNNERPPRGRRTSGGPKKWVDRSNQMPPPIPSKPMYPSYTHFHHQYSLSKPPHSPSSPSHERRARKSTSTSPVRSPKLTPEDEMTVKRLFDKLAVPTPPPTSSISSFFSNVSNDITLLELTPKMSLKTTLNSMFMTCSDSDDSSTSSSISSESLEPPNFLLDTPKSLSHTRSDSISCTSEPEAHEDEFSTQSVEDLQKPPAHTCPDETQCIIFRGGICVDNTRERREMLEWYNDLIQWRHDIVTKRFFGPPRCHPPPLTDTIIGASRAQRANRFQRVQDVHPFAVEAMEMARRRMDARRSHRLIPANLPLPPPHEFMENAKCLEPHLFIEYCYQLTAAAYVDTGLNPPNRRPPIPPRIEPIPEERIAAQSIRESISSASEISSDGEYSDDSDDTKRERLRLKMERHMKRERRIQSLFRRRERLDEIDEED